MSVAKTIVISCAGMGTRLGIGSTKALVDIYGKPLIIRQLEQLGEFQDIRIVVGYQAQQVIDTVLSYRKDVLFVFNHDYSSTGTGASLCLAARYAAPRIVSLDGDLLVHPDDLRQFLHSDEDSIGGCSPYTEEPMYFEVQTNGGQEYLKRFSRAGGDYEWTGLLQIETAKLGKGTGHVYQLINPAYPLKAVKVRTREIDTMSDYYEAVNWVRNHYRDQEQ